MFGSNPDSVPIVNTVFFAQEPGVPENMEVDDAIIHPFASLDVQVSRQRISLFLSQHTAYELLPESGKVVALDVTLPVKQAFHILYEHGVPVAPLWDFSESRFVGVLSAIDFILILRELRNHDSNLTEEELETHTILAWKNGKIRHNSQLVNAAPYDSLKDVAFKILQNKVSTVPIIHTSPQDSSSQQLLHLASLSEILNCICRHFKHSSISLPILHQPICSIHLGTRVPKMLKPNASLAAALSLLVEADVSSVPIVDDNDSLLDIYSRSDIISLAKDKAYAQIRLDEMSIQQALQLRVLSSDPLQTCLSSDPLQTIMDRLANPAVRRLVIVEAGCKRVEGIITLSDVFRFLLG
ncbi:sucrose nonfermenting 4-like protein [Silene latifolia]|uniref:sucrose nonfermenting 4-like protein n=1 Tax=Silene latifolia TaxID=37657 RepID=UPI003D76CE7A